MTTIRVSRPGARDEFGDIITPSDPPQLIAGARIAWAGTTIDQDRKTVVTTKPTVYIKRLNPDIKTGDVITAHGRDLKVIDTQPWEHPRREDMIMGVAVVCEEVR